MREYRTAMEAIGQVFLEQHPISVVIPADQLLKWVAEHGNHTLKAALLIGRMNQQLSAIRHHLNRGAAGRYRVDYNDAGHNTFIVRGTRSSVSRHDKPLLALIEAGGVNDIPVIMPVSATANTLIDDGFRQHSWHRRECNRVARD